MSEGSTDKPNYWDIDKPKYWVYFGFVGTVIRSGEFRGVVNGREHGVPHVHIRKGGRVAVVAIGSATERPYALVKTDMNESDLNQAYRLVEANRDACLAEWRRLNG